MAYKSEYLYESHLAFVEISSGIYIVGKDKLKAFGPGTIVSPEQVRAQLQKDKYKVILCKETLQRILYANFELEDNNNENL